MAKANKIQPKEVLIINADLLRQYGAFTDNVLFEKFYPYLLVAQQARILPILGRHLMRELQEQVKNDNLTPENSALIIEIAPCFAHYTLYYGLPFHWASIVEKGITILKSENSEALDRDAYAQIRGDIFNTAKTFENNLIEYLTECSDLYPLWGANLKNDCNECKASEYGFIFPDW